MIAHLKHEICPACAGKMDVTDVYQPFIECLDCGLVKAREDMFMPPYYGTDEAYEASSETDMFWSWVEKVREELNE